MIHKLFPRVAFALAACCSSALLGAPAAHAADFSAEYVFGDSLSDRGNVAELENVLNFEAHGSFLGNFPDPPSNHDSFTNGPVAVQILAQSLGLNANPSLWLTGFKDPAGLFDPSTVPGTNYAVAGATAAAGMDFAPGVNINLPSQIAAYTGLVSDKADPSALYVVMIGGNDVRNAALNGGETALEDGATAVGDGVAAELAAISTLAGEGAKHFLVVDVPNVGLIPEFSQATGPESAAMAENATTFSQLYDNELAAGVRALEPTLVAGSTLTDFDLYDYNAGLLADAGSLGFTNTTDPCFTDAPASATATTACGTDGANVNQFLYWDEIHPTAPVHALWAQGFLAAVPEPSTWAMMLLGFAALGFAGYRRALRTA